jgi:hypothetical protein
VLPQVISSFNLNPALNREWTPMNANDEAVAEAAPVIAEVKKLIRASSFVGTTYSRSLASIRGF